MSIALRINVYSTRNSISYRSLKFRIGNNGKGSKLRKDFEQQALSLYERATEVDDKWRVRLESKRKVAIQKSNSSQK
jgi:hypothetical protein